jgi:CelD/BcsL family acetyltransferase involved in cellulose biosynthesis
VQAALPEFFEMHIARFRASGRNSNLMDHERQVFLTELAQLLLKRRQVVLSRLMVGDHTVAWNYGFRFAGKWFYYQPTFDVVWQRYSPGLCLLAKIVEAACDNPEIELVDLGLGNEAYKKRFSTSARQTLHLTVTSSAARRWREAARYNAASVIKSSPFLENCVRRVLGRLARGAPA